MIPDRDVQDYSFSESTYLGPDLQTLLVLKNDCQDLLKTVKNLWKGWKIDACGRLRWSLEMM